MKQKHLLKSLLLLLALMVGSSAWADTVTGTITFGNNGVKINEASVTGADSQENVWTVTTVGTTSFTASSNYYQVGSSNKPATSITFTTTLAEDVTITAMSAKFGGFNSTAGDVTLKVDDTSVGTGSLNGANDVTVSSTTGATGKTLTVTVTDIAKGVKCYNISYTYEEANPSDPSVATTVTIDASGITNTNVYTGTAAGSLAATVKAGQTAINDAAVTWTSENEEVATINTNGEVTLVAAGTTTITASYAGLENVYKPSSATYTLKVTDSDPNAPGSENNPYTVAQARAAIDAGTGVTGVYATGIVSKIVTAYNKQFGNISFNISEDGTEEADQLEAYRCVGTESYPANDVQVGDIVVIYGDLKKYNSTYEFGQDCSIYSLERPVVPSINADDVELAYDATSGEIAYTIVNPLEAGVLTATTDDNWITNITVSETAVTFTTTANEDQTDRTATITLSYEGAEDKAVTVTQGHYVADFATLPFEFDGGKADIENTAGLTQSGLGTDYNSSPHLKFDGTGGYVILKIDETPGTLTFDIKGNSFSDGTFTVQASADGVTYSDLATYTELGTTQSEEFNNLGENIRYIKWIYTEKVNGNVALGNITLEAPSTDPVITVSKTKIAADAGETEGTIDLTYANIDINDMEDFGIQFYDKDGNELNKTDEPVWIEVSVASQDPQVGDGYVVSYYMLENEDAERTAYFKVFATGGNVFVYSNLVTITQAAYVAPATGDKYELFTGELVEGDYVIYYDGKAMNTTVTSDRLQYAEVTPENNVITTDDAAIVWHIAKSGDYWTIYNVAAEAYAASTGAKNKAQMLADGTDDKALWTVTGTETYEFVNKGNAASNVNANLRNNGTFGFACYATGTGGALSLYKKVSTETESITISSVGYRTYCSTSNLDFSNTGLTAYKATIANNQVSFTEVTEVPAGQGVLLKGAADTYEVPVIASAAELEDNKFIGVTEETTIDTDPANGIFVLMNPEGGQGVGFYKTTGSTFTLGAHTAYLPALGAGARTFIGFDFDNTTTAIEGIANVENHNGEVYNLQGQRVSKAQKGLYIVDGKKVLVK